MEELDEFEYGFERLRHILKDRYDNPDGSKPRPKMKREKAEELKQEEDVTTMASEKDKQYYDGEDEETMIEEITDEQAEAIEKEQAEKEEAERKKKEECEQKSKEASKEDDDEDQI